MLTNYKKNTYDMINLNSKMSKRPLDSALSYSEDILLQYLRNILT